MRNLLYILTFLFTTTALGQTQTITQFFTDRCTNEVKTVTANFVNGSATVAFYNRVKTFTWAEYTNGTLEAWLNETYLWWENLSPCSTATASSQTTQQTANNATSSATNAAANATSGATGSTGATGAAGTGSTSTGSTNTNTNGNTGSGSASSGSGSSSSSSGSSSGSSSSGSSGGDSGGSSSSGGDSTGGDSSNNTGNDKSGGNDSGNDSGGDSSGGSDSGGGDDQSGSDNSGDDNTSSDPDNSSGDGDSSDGDSSGESDNDSAGESEEGTDDSSNEDSSDESTDESSEESSEEESSEEVEEESSEEESSEEESSEEEKEEESTEEEKEEEQEEESEEEESEEESEEEEQEEEEKKEQQKKRNPINVSANLLTQSAIDGTISNAASFGLSQSSLTGTTTYSANLMVWDNLNQFSLGASKSDVYFNYDNEQKLYLRNPETGNRDLYYGSYYTRGSIMMIQSVSANFMYIYGTKVASFGLSNVYLGQKENFWKGFVGGFALSGTFINIDDTVMVMPSGVLFGTKPFPTKRVTISPMLALAFNPVSYSFDIKKPGDGEFAFNEHVTYIVGSNFDVNLTQRFKFNIGGNVIGTTLPGIPLTWSATIGSKFQF